MANTKQNTGRRSEAELERRRKSDCEAFVAANSDLFKGNKKPAPKKTGKK